MRVAQRVVRPAIERRCPLTSSSRRTGPAADRAPRNEPAPKPLACAGLTLPPELTVVSAFPDDDELMDEPPLHSGTALRYGSESSLDRRPRETARRNILLSSLRGPLPASVPRAAASVLRVLSGSPPDVELGPPAQQRPGTAASRRSRIPAQPHRRRRLDPSPNSPSRALLSARSPGTSITRHDNILSKPTKSRHEGTWIGNRYPLTDATNRRR